MRIDLIGPFPPPLGGVSVHLARLAYRLETLGIDVFRHGPQHTMRHFAYHAHLARAIRGADVVHIHTHGFRDLVLLSFSGRIHHHLVWTAHGDVVRDQFERLTAITKPVVKNTLQSLAAIVAVNDIIADDLAILGVSKHRIHVISPFIPPKEAEINEPPTAAVETFCRSHHPIFCAAAFTLADYQGVPLYGIDLAIDMMSRLKQRFPHSGLIIHLAGAEDIADPRSARIENGPLGRNHDELVRLNEMKRSCQTLGIEQNVLFLPGSVPFGPTLVRSDVLLRPTATDGDAVTIREALHLGIPTLASDSVPRPQGTVVFRHRDVLNMTRILTHLVENPPGRVPRSQPDATAPLVKLYQQISTKNHEPLSAR